MLAAAATVAAAAPFINGILRAQTLPPAPAYTYDVASIHKSEPRSDDGWTWDAGPQGGGAERRQALPRIRTAIKFRGQRTNDFKIEWARDLDTSATGPSIFTALTDQLGLRLESKKGPVQVYVVENIERSGEN